MLTQYYTATSLDGFIATDEDSLDWLFALGDPDESSYAEFIEGVGALAMGSTTYEWVLRNHIHVDPEKAAEWPYKQPTWVFSTRTLPGISGADVRFTSGPVAGAFEEIRAAVPNGNLWVVGGGDLAGQFHDAGLLDEIIVTIGSATLGSGKPLLPRAISPPTLRLESARRVDPGFAELRYTVTKGGAGG